MVQKVSQQVHPLQDPNTTDVELEPPDEVRMISDRRKKGHSYL